MNTPLWNEFLARTLREWEYLVFGAAAMAVLFSVTFRFLEKMDSRSAPLRREKNIAATLTMTLFFLAVYALARSGFGRVPLPPEASVAAKLAGCWLLILGAVINIAARMVIGRFWSDQIEIQPGHRVVRVWPYTWMRHPMYGSLVIFGLGLAFISANPLVAAAVLLVFLPVMARRARREEARLLEACAGDYAAFRNQAPMIAPHFPESMARWLRCGIAILMIWAMLSRSLDIYGMAGILTFLLSFAMARPDFRAAYKVKTGVIALLLVVAARWEACRVLLWIPVLASCMSVSGQCPGTLLINMGKRRPAPPSH